MFAVRTGAMADMIARHALVLEIDEMEALVRRMQPEIGNAYDIPAPDLRADSGKFVAGDAHKPGVPRGGRIGLSEKAAGKRHRRSGGERTLDEVTTVHASEASTPRVAAP